MITSDPSTLTTTHIQPVYGNSLSYYFISLNTSLTADLWSVWMIGHELRINSTSVHVHVCAHVCICICVCARMKCDIINDRLARVWLHGSCSPAAMRSHWSMISMSTNCSYHHFTWWPIDHTMAAVYIIHNPSSLPGSLKHVGVFSSCGLKISPTTIHKKRYPNNFDDKLCTWEVIGLTLCV